MSLYKLNSNILEFKSREDLVSIARSLDYKVCEDFSSTELINIIAKSKEDVKIDNTPLNLDNKNLSDLREIAKNLGIDAPYKYNKSTLKQMIIDKSSEIKSDDIDDKSEKHIRNLAKESDIKNPEKYNKDELIKLIKYKDEEDFDDTFESDNLNDFKSENNVVNLNKEDEHKLDLDDVSDNATNILENMDEKKFVGGILEILPDGYGFLRRDNYQSSDNDVYISPSQIRKFKLKTGDKVVGVTKPPSPKEKFNALLYVDSVNNKNPNEISKRESFENLIPIYPTKRIELEIENNNFATRMVDIISPLGKGQRGLIVSQPKSGKTTLLKMIAKAIETKYPEIHLMVLLIDERPEEVIDMKRSVKGEVISSTFDEQPKNHIKVAEMVIERAKRLVEQGEDVVILLDSITRLARAYNLTTPSSGKTLSGGLDPLSLYKPKKFFGAARNIEHGGSLTILATALVETGSRMDDIIFEEFKGTGNMEIHLDRNLSERRIFPAIDIYKSGTRREELLLSNNEFMAASLIRQAMGEISTGEVTEVILNLLKETKNNDEFVDLVLKNKVFNI